jgi:hypothetical protein
MRGRREAPLRSIAQESRLTRRDLSVHQLIRKPLRTFRADADATPSPARGGANDRPRSASSLDIPTVCLQARFDFLGKLGKLGQGRIDQRLINGIRRRRDPQCISLVVGRVQLLLEKWEHRLQVGGAPECRSYQLAGEVFLHIESHALDCRRTGTNADAGALFSPCGRRWASQASLRSLRTLASRQRALDEGPGAERLELTDPRNGCKDTELLRKLFIARPVERASHTRSRRCTR